MARTPRLKVYAAAAGFSEAVVAAPSQKAALQAWGARDDYFAHGIARVVDDPETVAAALAQPGVVLKRPVGSAEALVAAAKPPPRRRGGQAPATKPAPPPDRTALDEAEAALKTAQAALRELERAQREAREALERRQARDREAAEAEVSRRTKARDAARDAYRKAGG